MNKILSQIHSGFVQAYALPDEPDGWLQCNGQVLSSTNEDHRDLYNKLVDAGYPFGSSNGHPRVPDLRGEFIRGWDDGRGIDNGRDFGSAQSDENKSHIHTSSPSGTHTHPSGIPKIDDYSGGSNGVVSARRSAGTLNTTTGAGGDHTHTIEPSGGYEARPRNIALNYIIKL